MGPSVWIYCAAGFIMNTRRPGGGEGRVEGRSASGLE